MPLRSFIAPNYGVLDTVRNVHIGLPLTSHRDDHLDTFHITGINELTVLLHDLRHCKQKGIGFRHRALPRIRFPHDKAMRTGFIPGVSANATRPVLLVAPLLNEQSPAAILKEDLESVFLQEIETHVLTIKNEGYRSAIE